MCPTFFHLGPLPIHSYGVLLGVAFVVGVFFAMRRAPEMGVQPQIISDLALYILLGIVIGARLLHVLSDWGYYRLHPLSVVKVWEGGLAFHGGLIGAVAISIWYLRSRGISPWRVGDVIVPSVALGHAIGRLGCFLNGCCYGPVSDLPWAVRFPGGSLAAQQHYAEGLLESPGKMSLPVLPTQLISAAVLVVIFVLLLRITRRATFPGEVFWSYGVLYGVARFLLELIRGDNPAVLGPFSLYQSISAGIFLLSVVMLAVLRARGREDPPRRIYRRRLSGHARKV